MEPFSMGRIQGGPAARQIAHCRTRGANAMPLIRCDRCRRRCRRLEGWNVVGDKGVIVGHLCPDCQTPEENAEAEIKAATLNYFRDSQGRVFTTMKT
jgi:hypothetical protein